MASLTTLCAALIAMWAGAAAAVPAPTAAAAAAATAAPWAVDPLPSWRAFDWRFAGYQEGTRAMPTPRISWNVRDFGARGDGFADDSAALEQAVAAANERGGVIYFPPGNYKLTRPLTITHTGVVLRGAGQRQTIIDIPLSLGDYFSNSWHVNENGRYKSVWSAGGGFITFQGKRQSSDNAKSFLSRVSPGFVPDGQRVVPVESTAGFRVGQRIRIFVNDASTRGRRRLQQGPVPSGGARRLAGALATARGAPATRPTITKDGNVTLVTQLPPAWVAAHPVYQAAMEGALLLDAGDAGEGLTAQQALAAERAAAGEGPAAAAADWTVVSWLYGMNNVDSGGRTGVIDKDEIALSFRVVGVDRQRGAITLDRALPLPVYGASWSARVHEEVATIEDAGVERLTIRFPHTLANDHFAERGFNALQVSRCMNFWVRDVWIINADSGLFFTWVDRSTITDVMVGVSAPRVNPRWPGALNGHHAISITEGHSNMLARFLIQAPYIHDITVASGTSLNVVMEGRGADLNLDHHRTAPWANLFTAIDVGRGTRVFTSGGHGNRGAHSGRGNTYWNLYRGAGSGGGALALPECGWGPYLNFFGGFAGSTCPHNFWLVGQAPLRAPNLYRAQQAAAQMYWRRAG